MGGTDALPAPGLPGLLGRYVAVVTAVAASLLVLDAVPWLLTGAVRASSPSGASGRPRALSERRSSSRPMPPGRTGGLRSR